jgi:hypothetical protein
MVDATPGGGLSLMLSPDRTTTAQAVVAVGLHDAVRYHPQRARAQRDQLVEGSRFLRALEGDPASVDFADLQARLSEVAPEMAETAWGHKYFSLMAPTLIEPIHGADYRKHQRVS